MLIAAADRGLYQAKSEGRDRFCFTEIGPDPHSDIGDLFRQSR